MTDIEDRRNQSVLDNTDFEPKFIENFTAGINLENRADSIADSELLEARGVRFEEGRVLLDYGYQEFGQVVVSLPRAAFQFFRRNGSAQLMLVTDTRLYEYNTTFSRWHLISDGTKSTLVNNEITAATVIEVVDATGFSDADPIGIVLDDGDQHQTTVSGAPAGNTITITDGLPSAASTGNILLKAKVLTGTGDFPISLETWAASDSFYFTNFADAPQEFDGTDCIDIQNLPGTTFKCRVVSLHENHLMLLHTEEDGTSFPQRVRNCDTGDPTLWVPAASNNATFEDLYSNEDFILDAERIGTYLIIYRERSIVRQELVAQEDLLFDRETTITGEGVINGSVISNLGDVHVIAGNSNFYEYSGTFDLDVIGDKIRKKIYGQSGELVPAESDQVFSFYVEELDEVWTFYIKTGQTVPNRFVRYQVSSKSWAVRDLPVGVLGYGFFQATDSKSWLQLQGSWIEQTYAWNAKQLLNASPTVLLCGSDGQVYEYDFFAGDDDSTAIDYEVVTKDFFIPGAKLRTSWFEFKARGADISFQYSIDSGSTWSVLGTASPGVSYDRVRFHKDLATERIRFRWTGSGGGFGLEWFVMMWRPESLW